MNRTPARLAIVFVALVVVGTAGAVATGVITPSLFDRGASNATPTDQPTATPTPEPTATPEPTVHESYDQTTVRIFDADTGEQKGTVEAAIADNGSLRFTGLSETDSLPEDRGMLFTYDEPGSHIYVMRNMSFAIDIVYIDADGRITKIHHAPEPGQDEDGEVQHYPGEGQYVLEVNYEWTTERGIEEGDRVEFDLPE